jgi:signal peptidase I
VTDEPVADAELEEPAAPAATPAPKPKHHRSFLRELPFLLAIALVLTVLLRLFIVQAFFIPSGSMEQTLMINDRVVVNKIPYLYREPHRGEIVVFNGLDNFDEGVVVTPPSSPLAKAVRKVSSWLGFGAPSEKDYIKRVIGVAGDRVMCCDADGRVVVKPKDGPAVALDEPYVFEPDTTNMRYFCDAVVVGKPPEPATCPPGSKGILVPEGRLWVMGDHRSDSADSRYHLNDSHRGTVPVDKVVGRAIAIVTPVSRWGGLGVPETFKAKGLEALVHPGGAFALSLLTAVPVVALRRRYRSGALTSE